MTIKWNSKRKVGNHVDFSPNTQVENQIDLWQKTAQQEEEKQKITFSLVDETENQSCRYDEFICGFGARDGHCRKHVAFKSKKREASHKNPKMFPA